MTSSPSSSPESPTTDPQLSPPETQVDEGPRPQRGRSRSSVPPVTSLFQGGTTPTPDQLSETGPLSGNGSPLDEQPGLSGAAPGPGSSARSTSSKAPSPVSRRKMRLAARKGLQGASQVANDNFARDQLEVDAGLYVMSEDQAKMIGDPIADIGARRMSAAGVAGSPDIADGLMAIIGLAVYVADQLALRGAIRRHRRALQASGQLPADQADAEATQ